MIGNVHLIKTSNNKIVPVVILKKAKKGYYLVSQ